MPLAVDHICDYVTIRVIVFLLVLESSYDSLSVYEWYSVSLWHFASGQKTFTKRVDWTRFTDVVKSGKVGVQLKVDTCMLMQKTNYCSYKLFNDCLLHTCAVQESCWIALRTDYVTNLTPLPWLRQTNSLSWHFCKGDMWKYAFGKYFCLPFNGSHQGRWRSKFEIRKISRKL